MQAMEGSASEYSYAQNSRGQNSFFHSVAKPCLGDAIKHLVCKSLLDRAAGVKTRRTGVVPPYHIAVADLGCSYGRNTLDCAEFVVRALHENLASGEEDIASSPHNIMELQYFFSDLPSNDFNALFQSLHSYLHQSDSGIADPPPKFFAAGVPGSFHGRLFPTASLDLVISCLSLHWLSQVPPSLVDKTSPAWNGGHTWISTANPSIKAVEDAYAQQSKMDVRSFLESRAHELTSGGILFLLLLADQHHANLDAIVFDSSMDLAWKEMVDEGLIASEEMDMFNIKWYFQNQQELESVVKEVPELRVLHMETVEELASFPEAADRKEMAEQWVGLLCSTTKPAVDAHVGKSKSDELFKRFKTNCLKACFDIDPVSRTDLVVASLQRL